MINFSKFMELKEIYNYFGYKTQAYKLIEEMDELELAIEDGTQEEIIDELTDVLIVLLQIIFNVYRQEVEERTEYKISRTLERIKEGYYG